MISESDIPQIKQILSHQDSTFTEEGVDQICDLIHLGLWTVDRLKDTRAVVEDSVLENRLQQIEEKTR